MTIAHKSYITLLSVIVATVLVSLLLAGYSYYRLPLEERFFYPGHEQLKPGGTWGHGLGIGGTVAMISGIVLYMVRKRFRALARFGLLKHWLEFHIFLCTIGPVLVLFHTAFKFGGIVAISFWSMVAVFLSGIIGRFIYIQIPRTIEGREMSLNEIQDLRADLGKELRQSFNLDDESLLRIIASVTPAKEDHSSKIHGGFIKRWSEDRANLRTVRMICRKHHLESTVKRRLISMVKNEIRLNRRISRLMLMQKLFRYWHVAHLPFALIMLIIMVIHVTVTIVLGYRWIF
jgi:hypothetical protein